jgi:hypothetical protein
MDSKKRAREEESQNALLDPTFLLREQHKALMVNLARYKQRISVLEAEAAHAASTSASLQDVLSLLCRQLSAVRGWKRACARESDSASRPLPPPTPPPLFFPSHAPFSSTTAGGAGAVRSRGPG